MRRNEASSPWLGAVRRLHACLILSRRARKLAEAVSDALPQDFTGSVLDIGCGDGTVAALLSDMRPDTTVQGVEVAPRPTCAIKCTAFDGTRTDFPDAAFDIALLIDVLHHSTAPLDLLREAHRCATRGVVIKDHICCNRIDAATLRFMDWVHNRPRGVALPYSYLAAPEWHELFAAAGLNAAYRNERIGLYPFPFSVVFGRGLHFVARLEPKEEPS